MLLTLTSIPNKEETEKMSLMSYIGSIASQGTSLGGPSKRNFEMPWDQPRLNSIFQEASAITLHTTIHSASDQISVWLHRDGGALKRALGCFLLMMMPETGLDESVTWLKDAWDFYSYQPIKLDEPASIRRIGTITGVDDRPALIIEE